MISAAAYSNFCIVLRALGDLPGALKAIQRSLRLAETENAKLLFVGCLRNLTFIPEGIDVRDHLARAISEPWGRPTDLAGFASNLIKRSGAIGGMHSPDRRHLVHHCSAARAIQPD